MVKVSSITLRVGVCRKEGTEHYGSIGATAEVEVAIPGGASDEEITDVRDHYLLLCRATVERELDVQRGAAAGAAGRDAGAGVNGHAAPPPAREAAPGPPPHRKALSEWGTADRGEAARRPPAAGRGGGGGGARGGSNQDGTPRNGKALYARLKEMDEQDDDLGVVRHVSGWAKQRGNDARMSEWDRSDVADGWAEAQRYMEALRESASLQGSY